MTWLYVPSVCAPESAEPTSALSLSERLAPSVTWRGSLSPQRAWLRRCQKVGWLRLLCGVTCEPSTLERGVERWISSWRDFHAKPSQPQAVDGALPTTSGLSAFESSRSVGRGSYSQRMFPPCQSSAPLTILSLEDSERLWPRYPPPSWVSRITGRAGGFLPTPTRKANCCAPSMRKWPGCAAMQTLEPGATPRPSTWEWMMGFPIGWTDLRRWATQSCPTSQHLLSPNSLKG